MQTFENLITHLENNKVGIKKKKKQFSANGKEAKIGEKGTQKCFENLDSREDNREERNHIKYRSNKLR